MKIIELNDKLERYSVTAKGEVVRSRPAAERFGLYAAAMGVSLAMAGGADADVIYSGASSPEQSDPPAQILDNALPGGNLLTSTTSILPPQLDTLTLATTTAQSVSSNPQSAAGSTAPLGTSNGGAFFSTSVAQTVSGGPASHTQGSQDGQTSAASSSGKSNSVITGGLSENLNSFSFRGGIPIDNKWITLEADDFMPIEAGLTFFSLNFAATDALPVSYAATPASASPSSVPEPSPLALLAMGAAGIGVFRRRKANKAVC